MSARVCIVFPQCGSLLWLYDVAGWTQCGRMIRGCAGRAPHVGCSGLGGRAKDAGVVCNHGGLPGGVVRVALSAPPAMMVQSCVVLQRLLTFVILARGGWSRGG